MKKNLLIFSLFTIISLSSCVSNGNRSDATAAHNGINEKIFVPINGADQYLLIRGKNINNPVILYLHGGPGIPYTSVLYGLIDELQDDFTFVSWDQRGMGRTYYENQKNHPENNIITKEQALDDVDCVVDYLRNRFNKDKIIIIGHSYGSLLGITYVNNNPEKVEHYIGIAQSINYRQAVTNSYKEARKLLEDSPNKQEKLDKEFKYIFDTDDTKRSIKFQNNINKILEKSMPDLIKENLIKIVINSTDFNFSDFKWFIGITNIDKHISRNKELMKWLGDADLMKENKTFSLPISFISGAYDKTCPVELIENYIDQIKAPSKNLVIIPLVGHSPQLATPKAVAEAIRGELLH